MKNIIKIAIVSFFLLGILLLAARLFVGGGEDAWICDDGQWVRHGAPRAPMPEGVCESKWFN